MLKFKSNIELEEEIEKLNKSENYIWLVRIIEEQISREKDKNKVKKLKKELKDAVKKTQKNMKSFTQEVKFTKKQVDSIIEYFTKDKNIDEILQLVWYTNLLYPNVVNVHNVAKKTMPVTLDFVSIQLYNEKWDIIKYWSIADTYWYFKIYGIHFNIIVSIYLQNIFAYLEKTNLFKNKDLTDYLNDLLVFTWNKEIVEKWLERFFQKDYISSLHILIPQFENIFMLLSEKLWIDITKIWNPNKKKWESSINTWTKTLWLDKLDSDEFKDVWWEDICELIKYILYHDLGFKLRHQIAHWEIDIKDCNYINNLMIVYLYILLATRINIWKQ